MTHFEQPRSFIVVLEDLQDAQLVDIAVENKKLGYEKLGEKTYLAFCFENPAKTFTELKEQLGLHGKAHWIPLAHAVITG